MRSVIAAAFAMLFALPLSAAPVKGEPLPANANLKPITVDEMTWIGDLSVALELAAKDKKLVFVDFTGVTCTNCKINEKNVFSKTEVKDLFKQYIRVQLYADTVPEAYYVKAPDEAQREKDAELNQGFQKKTFNTEQLPLYVIVKPAEGGSFEVIGVYDEGRINKVDKFLEFLKKPLKAE